MVNSIKMNLDFSFNTSQALKESDKLGKSFGLLTNISKALNTNMEFIGVTGASAFGDVNDLIFNNAKTMEGFSNLTQEFVDMIKKGGIDEMSGSLFKVNETLKGVFEREHDVIKGLKGMSEQTAIWAAAQAEGQILKKTSESMGKFKEQMEALSVSMSPESLVKFQTGLAELAATDSKAYKKLNSVLDMNQELMGLLNTKQLSAYRQNMEELAAAQNNGTLSIDEYTKAQKALNDQFEITAKKLPKLKKELLSIGKNIVAPMTTLWSLGHLVQDTLQAQQNSAKAIHYVALQNEGIFAGTASKAALWETTLLKTDAAIRRVGGDTAISLTEASEAFSGLAELRVSDQIKDLEQLTITSVQMGQAFGISQGQSAELMRTLSLVGGIGTEGIKAVGNELAKTQAVWGMTSEEASVAAKGVANVINRMTRMGSTSKKNATIVAKEVGRMTTAFTRAGLSASDATALIDRFLDPDKLEDNVFLWSKMGISAADGLQMMAGDASVMGGMTENLQKVAFDLKNEFGGNALALNEMSKAMGLSIQQVNQLSEEYKKEKNMSASARAELAAKANLEKQADASRRSAQDQIKKLANLGNILMANFLGPLIDILTFIIRPIAFIFQWVSRIINKFERLNFATAGLTQVIKFLVGGFVVLSVVLNTNILKMIKSFGGLKDVISGTFSHIKNFVVGGAKLMKGFASDIASSIGPKGTGGLFKKFGKTIGDTLGKNGKGPAGGAAEGAAGAAKETATKNVKAPDMKKAATGSKAMKEFSKIPAKNILSLAVAIIALAVAVFIMAHAFKAIMEAVKGASAGEIVAGIAVLIVIIGGLCVAIKMLEQASKGAKKAAPGLLALGAALVLLATAAAIMMLAFAQMMKTISTMDNDKIAMGIAVLIVIVGSLCLAIKMLEQASKGAAKAAPGLLALGAALVLLAGAAALMMLSFAKMMETLSTMDNDKIAMGLAVLAVVLIGLCVAIFLMGSIGAAAAPGILAVGLALLMMGAAVAIVILSMAVLLSVLKDMSGPEMIAGIVMLVVVMGVLAVMILVLGSVGTAAAPGIIIVAVAILLIGVAIALIVLSIAVLINALTGLFTQIASIASPELAAGIAALAASFFLLVPALLYLGLVMIVAGPALMMLTISFGLLGIVASMLGNALTVVANSLASMFVSITEISATIKESCDAIAEGLGVLTVVLVPLAAVLIPVTLALFGLSASLGLLAIVAIYVAIPLGILGAALTVLGFGINLIAKGLPSLDKLLESVKSIGEIDTASLLGIGAAFISIAVGLSAMGASALIGAVGIALLLATVPAMAILGVTTSLLANNFYKMGLGIDLMAKNLATASSGIDELKAKLSGCQGMSDAFVSEIQKMNEALVSLNNLSAKAIITSFFVKESSNSQKDNGDEMNELMSRFDEANDSLYEIKNNTKDTVSVLDAILKKLGSNTQTTNINPQINIPI